MPDGNDLVFVDNATTGCNAVAAVAALFQPGDEVLILSHAYGAVRNAVRYVTGTSQCHDHRGGDPVPGPDRGWPRCAADHRRRLRPAPAWRSSTTSPPAAPSSCRSSGLSAACHDAGVPVLDRRRPRARPDRSRPDRDRRRLVCRQLPQMAVRPERLRLPARAAGCAEPVCIPGTISHGYRQGLSGRVRLDRHHRSQPVSWPSTAALDFHQQLGGARLRQRNKCSRRTGRRDDGGAAEAQVGARRGRLAQWPPSACRSTFPPRRQAWAIRQQADRRRIPMPRCMPWMVPFGSAFRPSPTTSRTTTRCWRSVSTLCCAVTGAECRFDVPRAFRLIAGCSIFLLAPSRRPYVRVPLGLSTAQDDNRPL